MVEERSLQQRLAQALPRLMQETPEAVYAKHEELAAAGLAPGKVNGPFEVLGARWTAFSCALGDGLEIEINHRTRSALLDR